MWEKITGKVCIRIIKCGRGILCDWWMVRGKKRQDAKHVICLIIKQCLVSTCKSGEGTVFLVAATLSAVPAPVCIALSLTRPVIQGLSIKMPMFSYSAGKWCSQGVSWILYVNWILMSWHTVFFLCLLIHVFIILLPTFCDTV